MSNLTPYEHARAQKIAYAKSLARGHGQDPPPYDHDRSVGDFWQAAGEVIVGRTTVEMALAGFHFKVIEPLFEDIRRTLEVTCHFEGDDNHGSNFIGNGVVLSGIEAVAQFTDDTPAADRTAFAAEAKKRYKALEYIDPDLQNYLSARHSKVDGSYLAQEFMKKYCDEPIATQVEFGTPVRELVWAFRNPHLHAFYPYYQRNTNRGKIQGGVLWMYRDTEKRIGIRIHEVESRFDEKKNDVYQVKNDWFLVCPQLLFVFFKRAVERFLNDVRQGGVVQNRFMENWERLAPSYGVEV